MMKNSPLTMLMLLTMLAAPAPAQEQAPPPEAPAEAPPGASPQAPPEAPPEAPADSDRLDTAELDKIANTQITGRDVAVAYGVDQWHRVTRLRFTFNAKREQGDLARAWDWDVANDRVTRTLDGESVTIEQLGSINEDSDQATRDIHRQFINDSYWFLFPFQLEWSDPTVTEAGSQPLPIGEGRALKLVCQWPDEGGYTPGDAYDLYLGTDGLIQQWAFRRGGGDKASAMTWENHQQLGPMIVCLDHHGEDGEKRLWFSDVVATLTGETAPVTPTPMVEP